MEHFDVLIVGAGLSGIGAAHHLVTDTPWASYAIFEARDAIGGTWDLFRYPGIRSDSDMYTLAYPFKPWQGTRSLADGPSIRQYIVDTAAEAGIDRHIRYHHRIVRADWSSDDTRWTVTAERTDTGETVEVTTNFLYSCSGYYRYDRGYLPDFEGTARFGGRIIHPQEWPEDLDYRDKRVIVIGSGATAITLVPSMAPDAAHVTMLQRSPTYVITRPAVDPIPTFLKRVLPFGATDTFIRWFNALTTQGFYRLSRRRPELVKQLLRRDLVKRLPAGYDVDTHFTPSYNPWDERVCAVEDGDLFREIRNGKVDIVTDRIVTFTEDGLLLESGTELTADIIITATGLELLFLGGIELTVDGEKVDHTERLTYKGMMLDGVPNLAFAVGYTNASWTLKADLTAETVCRILNHMHRHHLHRAVPRSNGAPSDDRPLLDLRSGYIQRAADRLPRQGTAFPWQVYQSWLADLRALRRSPVDDDVMDYSDPTPARTA